MTARPPVEVRWCPRCGASLAHEGGFVQEYWAATDRHFVLWCPDCWSMSTVTVSDTLQGVEVEHHRTEHSDRPREMERATHRVASAPNGSTVI